MGYKKYLCWGRELIITQEKPELLGCISKGICTRLFADEPRVGYWEFYSYNKPSEKPGKSWEYL